MSDGAPLEIAVFLVVVALLNGLQASSTLWTASYRGVERDNNVHNPVIDIMCADKRVFGATFYDPKSLFLSF
jgi:hypothetical protein